MPVAARLNLYKEIVGATLIAALWLALQGFQFGIANNIFHIPFVLRWSELPQYANDPFYQTLDSFTSALWWLVRLFATEESLRSEFLAIHVMGRIAAVVAMVLALRTAVPEIGLRLLAVLFATSSPLFRNESFIGGHGLFLDYLTHTEFLWPFFIAALACAARGYWRWAAAMVALTFSLNAFVGLWCAAIVAAAVYLNPNRPSFKVQMQAGAVFAIVALPVAIWILQVTSHSAPAEPFSFREYVRAYYPAHFLIEAARWTDILNLASVVVLTSLVSREFGWRFWNLAVLTLAGLFVVGVVLPYLVDSRVVFNLHFLRLDGAILFVATPLLALAAFHYLLRSPERERQVQGCALLLGCIAGQLLPVLIAWAGIRLLKGTSGKLIFSAAAAALLTTAYAAQPFWLLDNRSLHGIAALCFVSVALSSDTEDWKDWLITAGAAVVLLGLLALSKMWGRMGIGALIESLLGLGYLIVVRHQQTIRNVLRAGRVALSEPTLRQVGIGAVTVLLITMQAASVWAERPEAKTLSAADRDWIATVAWVREHSPAAPVLVPLKPAGVTVDHDFQLNARAPVWVDWKQGAAVMWAPSFHSMWRRRFDDVRELQTPEQFASYALTNHIATFVVPAQPDSPPSCDLGTSELWRSARFAVCATPQISVTPRSASMP